MKKQQTMEQKQQTNKHTHKSTFQETVTFFAFSTTSYSCSILQCLFKLLTFRSCIRLVSLLKAGSSIIHPQDGIIQLMCHKNNDEFRASKMSEFASASIWVFLTPFKPTPHFRGFFTALDFWGFTFFNHSKGSSFMAMTLPPYFFPSFLQRS